MGDEIFSGLYNAGILSKFSNTLMTNNIDISEKIPKNQSKNEAL